EALLLFRSVRRMGGGWIGKCYAAFSAGVFLILLGDAAIWATAWGYLPWPWSALTWFVWIPAAGAFALGPAYPLEAMQQAISRQTRARPRAPDRRSAAGPETGSRYARPGPVPDAPRRSAASRPAAVGSAPRFRPHTVPPRAEAESRRRSGVRYAVGCAWAGS